MSTYRYAVRRSGGYVHCEGCGDSSLNPVIYATWYAHHHAAACESLHRANWDACCPSCKAYGRIAPACPVCLGYGHIVEREVLT